MAQGELHVDYPVPFVIDINMVEASREAKLLAREAFPGVECCVERGESPNCRARIFCWGSNNAECGCKVLCPCFTYRLRREQDS